MKFSRRISQIAFIIAALSLLGGYWQNAPVNELIILRDISASVEKAQYDTAFYTDKITAKENVRHFLFADQTVTLANASLLDRRQTNLAAALQWVARLPLSAPRVRRRVLLFTDGQANTVAANGDDAPTVAAQFPGLLEIVPLNYTPFPDAKIIHLQIPPCLVAGSKFLASALVECTPTSRVVVTLTNEVGEILSRVEDEISPAGKVVELSVELSATKNPLTTLTARVELVGDRVAENNAVTAATLTEVGAPILWLGEKIKLPATAIIYASLAELPRLLTAASRYSVIVINQLAGENFSAAATAAIKKYVNDGGNLIVIGGGDNWSNDQMINSPLAAILPVKLFPENLLTIVLALDISGSMGEVVDGKNKITQALRALRVGLQNLPPAVNVGVVLFARAATTAMAINSATATAREIATLSPTPHGGTSIFAGAETALKMLTKNTAPQKHIVMLTDGETTESGDELRAKISALRTELLKSGVGISFVAMGEKPNSSLLAEIAAGLGNVTLTTADAVNLPQILQVGESMRTAASIVVRQENLLTAPFNYDTSIARYWRVGELTSALNEVWLATEYNDILLATGNVGLGKVFWFNGSPLTDWQIKNGADFLAQLMIWLTTTATPNLRAGVFRGELFLQSSAPTATLRALNNPRATLPPEILTLARAADGEYRAKIPAPKTGLYAIDSGGEKLAIFIDERDELLYFGVNNATLTAIATAAKGKIITTPAMLADWEEVPILGTAVHDLSLIAFIAAILFFGVGLISYERTFSD